MPFTPEQKIKIVQFWYETKSYVAVRRRVIREFELHPRDGPDNKAIRRLVKHLESTGTVHNTHKGHSGRPAAVTKSQANIDAVRESVVASPKKSHGRRSQELGLSPASTLRIMDKELKLFPYVISTRHKLTDNDREKRKAMCDWLSQKMERNPGWIKNVWFSDEAHFHLNGAINSHNNIFWGSEPPEETTDKLAKGPKVTAFVAYNIRHGLLGPYWFEEGGRTVTVNGERYREVIGKFHADLSASLTENQLKVVWFMQDGAPPHTAHDTIAHLHDLFNNRLISLGTVHEWAPHSPDLNPLDFWLWGAAKGSVYADKPATLTQLKRNVAGYMERVSHETLRKVGVNFGVRVKACLNRGGAHIENVKYKRFA